MVDGQPLLVSKNSGPRELRDLRCAICGIPYKPKTLYGLITSTLWMDCSMVDGQFLAIFCDECTESHKISLCGQAHRLREVIGVWNAAKIVVGFSPPIRLRKP